jgi:hypothetical protein
MNEDRNPFNDVIEPDEIESKQICWRNSATLCGEDCVAYDEKCMEDPRWGPCLLLNLKRAKAKSYANIATELKRLNDGMNTVSSAARRRTEAAELAQKLKEEDPGPPEIR